MSSAKSSSSAGDSAWKELQDRLRDGRGGEILKMGYLKKLKTMKKKFFVLRSESSQASARLEYYDSEKKWRNHHSPKRSIALKTCFNINRRTDTKHKHVIALYTKDDCFCVVLESEEDLEEWLNSLLALQHGEDVPDGEQPKPTFEHVWQVSVQKKGLGNSRHILGPHLLCLTDKTVSLVSKEGPEDGSVPPLTYEFSLLSIRRCGHSDCFFYMEVGRSTCTGAGDLWMETDDPNIAQNMHFAIMKRRSPLQQQALAMAKKPGGTDEEPNASHNSATSSSNSNNNNQNNIQNSSVKEDIGPRPRTRSSSAIESSKPITVLPRKTSHLGSMKTPSYYSTSEEASRGGAHLNFGPSRIPQSATYIEHPAMSPSTPEGMLAQVCVGSLPGSYHCHHTHHRVAPIHHPPVPTPAVRPSQRRHSVSAMCVSSVGGAGGSGGPLSATTTTTTTITNNNNNVPLGAPTHQRTYSFPLSEPSSGLAPATPYPPSWDGRRASTGRSAGKRSAGASSSRSRYFSLPARPVFSPLASAMGVGGGTEDAPAAGGDA